MRGGAVLAKGLTFERSEKKYLLDDAQYGALKAVLERHMEEDAYGEYTVCNLYFDTEHNDLIRRSIENRSIKKKCGYARTASSAMMIKSFWKSKRNIKAWCINAASSCLIKKRKPISATVHRRR